MNKKNQNGFIELIAYLIVFAIFSVTLIFILETLDLVDMPEQYSVRNWVVEHFKIKDISKDDIEIEFERKGQNRRVEIVDDNSERSSNAQSPFVQGLNMENTTNNDSIKLNSAEFLYYDQLDKYGKIIYSELEKNLDNMKSGTYNVKFGTTFDDLLHEENGEEVLNNSFQLAVNALNFDYPETFFIDVPKLYLLTQISKKLWSTTYTVEIGCKQGENYINPVFGNEEGVNQAIEQVRNKKNAIKASLTGNTEEQIKSVHNYLVENLEYDSTVSKDNIYNIYGALINNCTVCEGYARAFKYIMDDLNIPCLIACGTAINNNGEMENHAWNYVELDGKWYAIDVTWDDPIIIGNGYVNSSIKYRYYLKGSTEFFANHTEKGDIVGDARFKYPTLSTTNY